jgi:hypothetical protein
MKWKLFLDDGRYPVRNDWVIARNFDDAVWYVRNYGLPDHIAFDHDLGHPKNYTGMDFAKWFANYIMDNELKLPQTFSYSVHSQNPVGAANIRSYMDQFLENHELMHETNLSGC